MRILHTGDIHLDSAFSSEAPALSEARREAQRKVFSRIIDTVISEKCDLLLIAGDLFDSSFVSPETKKLVISAFASLPCPVVISPGNHDPYVEGCFYRSPELSDNVYVFSSNELQRFDFPELGVNVYGYAFTSQSLKESPLLYADKPIDEGDGVVNILCAHAELSIPTSRFAPTSPALLSSFGFSYAALGHIHKISDPIDLGGGALASYGGFPEGRSFDELGDGRVLLVDIEDGIPSVTPIYISENKYVIDELKLDAEADIEQIEKNILSKASEHGSSAHLRLVLSGFAYEGLVDSLAPVFKKAKDTLASLEVVDDTLPALSAEILSSDISLRGELYRTLLPSLMSEDREKRDLAWKALKIGIAAIDGKNILNS